MSVRKRPANVPYPKIYKEFEGKLIVDGKKRQFWVQDLTEEYFDEVLHGYKTGFMFDEPLCKYAGYGNNPICVEQFGILWTKLFHENMSLICLTKDEDGTIKVAGFNCLYRAYKKEEDPANVVPEMKQILGILDYLTQQKDIYKEFEIEDYVSALGLYVLPEFRGEGLGQIILNCRDDICKALGFKVTVTLFSSFISQKQAPRAGFKEYFTISYEDMFKNREDLYIPGIQEHTKLCKLMYKLY